MTLANLTPDELEPEQAEAARQAVVARERSTQVQALALASALEALTREAQVLAFQSEDLIQVYSKLKLVRKAAQRAAVPEALARRVARVGGCTGAVKAGASGAGAGIGAGGAAKISKTSSSFSGVT